MTKDNVMNAIEDVIVFETQIEPGFDYSRDLYGELGVEHLDSVPMVMGIEERFGIAIADPDFLKLRTVEEIADHVSFLI